MLKRPDSVLRNESVLLTETQRTQVPLLPSLSGGVIIADSVFHGSDSSTFSERADIAH